MAGTKVGGLKAAKTNKLLHGDDFYAKIGKKGGQNGHTGGFAYNPALAQVVGSWGGKKSKRGKAYKEKIEKNAKRVVELMDAGVSCKDISKAIEVPYHSLLYWVRKEREK